MSTDPASVAIAARTIVAAAACICVRARVLAAVPEFVPDGGSRRSLLQRLPLLDVHRLLRGRGDIVAAINGPMGCCWSCR